jgi:hypothetical protein
MRHRPQHRTFDPLRLRLMSAAGWVVLGDGNEVEQRLERQSDGALPGWSRGANYFPCNDFPAVC